MINCMLAGVGGQGTVLASKLIAAAAIRRGLDARTTETIGMAQRGGSVVSHIRLGERICSPLIARGTADILIALEPAEAVRQMPYLAPSGILFVCDTAVMPVKSALGGGYRAADMLDYIRQNVKRHIVLDGGLISARCGFKALNVALLGAAVQSGAFPFDANDLEETVKSMIAPRHLEMNLAALDIGRSFYDETTGAN